jgi:hypothetical protein
MDYDKEYEKAKAEWQKKHPNQDYDEYIDGLINEDLET